MLDRKDKLANRRKTDAFQGVKIANCAGCRVEVTNRSDAKFYGMEILFGRISDRPYCEACFKERQVRK